MKTTRRLHVVCAACAGMVLACGELANGVGVFIGLELGHLCNSCSLPIPRSPPQ